MSAESDGIVVVGEDRTGQLHARKHGCVSDVKGSQRCKEQPSARFRGKVIMLCGKCSEVTTADCSRPHSQLIPSASVHRMIPWGKSFEEG